MFYGDTMPSFCLRNQITRSLIFLARPERFGPERPLVLSGPYFDKPHQEVRLLLRTHLCRRKSKYIQLIKTAVRSQRSAAKKTKLLSASLKVQPATTRGAIQCRKDGPGSSHLH